MILDTLPACKKKNMYLLKKIAYTNYIAAVLIKLLPLVSFREIDAKFSFLFLINYWRFLTMKS